MSNPGVSVVMSVYDGERYLREAINSILNQTLADFEFIIVDDGSTDGTPEILEGYAARDERIRLERNAYNLGLTPSLNKGLQLTRGEYIARQDADDISLPQRLASQANFLDDHPEVGVIGTWINNFDENGRQIIWQTPISHPLIRWSLLFGASIAGPSVMMRRFLLEGDTPFRPEMLHAEDYDLWARLSDKTQFANLRERLYLRRMHKDRISVRYYKEQEETVKSVMHENITRLLGNEVREASVEMLRHVTRGELLKNRLELQNTAKLFLHLYRAYVKQSKLDAVDRKEVAADAARRLTRVSLRHIDRFPAEAILILWEAVRLGWQASLKVCIAESLKRKSERI
ncbi:MAG: glycosyltransferase [Desulfobacterales bacterium]|nr:glycosyltransferase [Desulfobacterales bacterium]